jgi:hypothetical protein
VQSAQGAKVYARLCAEWADMEYTMDALIKGGEDHAK